jgi:acetyltransferase
LPPLAAIRNPVDVTPQAYSDPKWFAQFPGALDAIAADPGVDSVFFQLGPMARGDRELAQVVVDFRRRSDAFAIVAWPLIPAGARDLLGAARLHAFPEYARAVRAMARLAEYREARGEPEPGGEVGAVPLDWAAAVPDARAGMTIGEHACHAILARAGLGVAPGRLAGSEQEAVEIAREFDSAVAMKGISASVTHRAAAGLVALGLRSEPAIRAAWQSLQRQAAQAQVRLDGIYVQRMLGGGTELLLSAFRDPLFGVFVSVGAGGGLTELIDDVVLAAAPLDTAAARRALRRLRIVRKAGAAVPGLDAAADYVALFSRIAAGIPWQSFMLELNPLIWSGDAVTAVDGLLLIERP